MTTCRHPGCDREPTCVPKLVVPAKGYALDAHQPIEIVLGLEMCDEHFATLDVDDFIDPRQPKGIYDVVSILTRDKAPVDWSRAFFEKVPCDTDEYRAAVRATASSIVDADKEKPCDS